MRDVASGQGYKDEDDGDSEDTPSESGGPFAF